MTYDIDRVQRFANWFRDRTGIKLSLGEAFELYSRYEKGENVLWSQLPRLEITR